MKDTSRRAVIIVMDSVGCGALPDASRFHDRGASTLGHLAAHFGKLNLPHLAGLGLGKIVDLKIKVNKIEGSYGRMHEVSNAKDTIIGHWEIAGVLSKKPFPLYPEGFPPELMAEYEKRIGRKTLGNYPMSGTEILKQLGGEHYRTGFPIVYTSGDSVFQIAAHEKIVPLKLLYQWCNIARKMLTGKHGVGRVIARPFVGMPGQFKRTYNRKDFSLESPRKTLLDEIKSKGMKVVGIGKIGDIFAHRGTTREIHTEGNADSLKRTVISLKSMKGNGLVFTNLVDFDSLYGHRRDPEGYYGALREFDSYLPAVKKSMRKEDILIITADHGCDPLYRKHTDHTREYVPLLVYSPSAESRSLGTRTTFSDVARTLDEYFGLGKIKNGRSFLEEIWKK